MSKNFYFSFGDDRLDKFVKITAKDEKIARSRMFKECGRQWCTSYCEEDFLPIIKERNLKQLFHFVCWDEEEDFYRNFQSQEDATAEMEGHDENN